MTCQNCDAELPPYALFCGECGRSVSAPAIVPPVVHRPTAPASVEQQAPLSLSFDTPTASLAMPSIADALPWSADAPLSIGSPESAPSLAVSLDLGQCAECGTQRQPGDRYCSDCGSALSSDTTIIEPLSMAALPESLDEPLSAVARADSIGGAVSGTTETSFVLQFSTGESYTVLGSGLVGRHPRPEPGEFFEHMVSIVDPGRSISKTHLEFGHESGAFWVSDRHSGNGTVIREPGAHARVCEPGRRYAVVRGTRIDIGEQFMVVS